MLIQRFNAVLLHALLMRWQVIPANFVLFCNRSNFCHPPGSYFTEVIKNNNNKQPFQSRQLTESCHKGTLRCDVKPELSAKQRSLQQRCTELQWLSQTCTYITVYCSLFRSASVRVASNGPGHRQNTAYRERRRSAPCDRKKSSSRRRRSSYSRSGGHDRR